MEECLAIIQVTTYVSLLPHYIVFVVFFFLSISKPGFSHIISAFQGFPDHQPTPHQFLTSPEFKITFAPPLNGSQLFNNNSLAAFSLSAINQSAQKLKSLLPHQTCGSTSNGGSTNMVSSKNWANKDTN